MHFSGGEQLPKLPLSLGDADSPHNTQFLRPTEVHTPNCISIGSSVFVGFTVVPKQQTDTHTVLHLLQEAASLPSLPTAMCPNNNNNNNNIRLKTRQFTEICHADGVKTEIYLSNLNLGL